MFLTYQMASDYFGHRPNGKPIVSTDKLRRAVASRALCCHRPGHRTVFFRPVDLERWIKKQIREAS